MTNEMETKSNVKQVVPFFMVTNIEASIDFYVKGLGFELTKSWIDNGKMRWCWLSIGDAALMLQEFQTDGQRENVSKHQGGGGMEIFFICEDALKIYNEINVRGIPVSEPFVGNNMWVVGLNDPDNYRISFESPTDVAEETNYSEWIKEQGPS